MWYILKYVIFISISPVGKLHCTWKVIVPNVFYVTQGFETIDFIIKNFTQCNYMDKFKSDETYEILSKHMILLLYFVADFTGKDKDAYYHP